METQCATCPWAARRRHHPPARGGHLHRVLLRGVARAGHDHDVGAEPIRRAHHRRIAVLVLGVDVGDALVADDRAGELQPRGGPLEQEHQTGALQPRECRVRGADGTGADHDDGVIEADGDVLVAADHVDSGSAKVAWAGDSRRGMRNRFFSAMFGIATRSATRRDDRSPSARRSSRGSRRRRGTAGSGRTRASRCSARRRRARCRSRSPRPPRAGDLDDLA